MKAVYISLRLLLGIVFTFAGIQKVGIPVAFADAIASFHLLSPPWITRMALGLPLLEIATGMLLLLGIRQGAFLALVLCGCFAIAFLSAMLRGIEVHCGCFGSFEIFGTTTRMGLVHSVILLGMSALLYRKLSKH